MGDEMLKRERIEVILGERDGWGKGGEGWIGERRGRKVNRSKVK